MKKKILTIYENQNEINVSIKINNVKKTISLGDYVDDYSIDLKKSIKTYFNYINKNKFINSLFPKLYNINLYNISSVIEGNYYKTNLDQVIFSLALNKIILRYKPNIIIYKLKDKVLYQNLKSMFKNLDIRTSFKIFFQFSFKENLFYHFSKGLFFSIKLLFVSSSKDEQEVNDYLLISPFSNYELKFSNNRFYFHSNLWGELDSIINKSKKNITFLHITNPFLNIDLKIKKGIKNISSQNKHILFRSNLSLKKKINLIGNIIFNFFKFLFVMNNIKKNFLNYSNHFNCWHSLKLNYFDSLFGYDFVINYIQINYFKNLFDNNYYSKILFLYEYQNWEKIILNLNINNKKNIYGVIHSSIRFWDLRFLKLNKFIYPDRLLVNSKYNYNELISNGFNKNDLILVESLRFNHFNLRKKTLTKNNLTKLLVLLDYSDQLSIELINFLKKYDDLYSGSIEFIFKKHKNTNIDLSKFGFKRFSIEKKEIHNLNRNYYCCITSNMTSAQIDVLENDFKLIIFSNKKRLNLSPLYNKFKSNYLYEILDLKKQMNLNRKTNKFAYYIKSKELKLWKSFIKHL